MDPGGFGMAPEQEMEDGTTRVAHNLSTGEGGVPPDTQVFRDNHAVVYDHLVNPTSDLPFVPELT